MNFRNRTLAALTCSVAFSSTALANEAPKGPPFADGPDTAQVAPRPERRVWTVVRSPFTFGFEFEPGIAVKGQVSTITVAASETPKTPHPRYGSNVPLQTNQLVAVVRDPSGAVTHRHTLHRVPLVDGKYAFHLTTDLEGIHEIELIGKLADGRPLAAKVKLPVDVWPLPSALQGTGDKAAAPQRRAIRRPVSK